MPCMLWFLQLFEKERLANELISQQMTHLQQELKDARLEVEDAKESNGSKSKLTSETGFHLQVSFLNFEFVQ